MIKRFLEWIGLKERLHGQSHEPPFFRENEIWWCHVGENIGVEINGKNDKFTRPIFILKKYDKYSFLGLPFSTKNKIGNWYVSIYFAGVPQVAILSQSRVFDYRRLYKKIGELTKKDGVLIREAFTNLHMTA